MAEVSESGVQSDNKADGWSDNAKEYSKLASKVPIVTYFSDSASQLLIENYPNALKGDGVSLLEVCAGPGTFSLSLIGKIGAEAANNTEFLITDYSSGMVDAAKIALEQALPQHRKLNFQVVDVQDIPLPADSHDVVACMFGYFVPDRLKAFSEVCRVMKPTGVCVIGTWKYAALMYIMEDFFKFLGRLAEDGETSTFKLGNSCNDPVRLRAELIECGFKDVEIHEPTEIFPIPLTEQFSRAWFSNPMVKDELESFTFEFLYGEWIRLLSQKDKYPTVDLENMMMNVEYTALICFATK